MIHWRNRGNKYGAVKTVVDGITFDSKAEARRYQELRLLNKKGEISPPVVHPRYSVGINHTKICDVVLDFLYFNYQTQKVVYEDVKGRDTAISRLKRKMLEAHNTIKVDVISAGSPAGKKNASRPSPPSRRGSPKRDSK